jgi:hypothetical protein
VSGSISVLHYEDTPRMGFSFQTGFPQGQGKTASWGDVLRVSAWPQGQESKTQAGNRAEGCDTLGQVMTIARTVVVTTAAFI